MLDPRIYRAGWIPVLFVVVLVAFSLREPPRPAQTTLSAQAFNGGAALALARGFARNPVPGPIERRLRRAGFSIRVAGSGPHRTVLAERTGFSSRRVALVADRRSPTATATLMELGQALGGRTLGRTLVLASVAGPDPGTATDGLRARLGGPVDAAIVIGDVGVGAARKPWVVPWGDREPLAPLALRRTVESAMRAETGTGPGTPGLGEQLGRLAFPLTLGAEAPLLDHGLPAALVSSAGERGAPAGALPANRTQLEVFGRGVLRAATALDASGPVPPPERTLLVSGKVFPEWAVRALSAALLLPLLLALLDGFARVRRRRGEAARWLGWALAGAAPFAVAVLALRALGATGALRSAPTALAIPLGATGAAVLALLAALLVLGWLARRPFSRRALHLPGDASAPGAALGAVGMGFAAAAVLWLGNPYAAGLAALALHLWLLAVAPETRPRRAGALVLVGLGALPILLVGVGYASAFGLGPLRMAWTGLLGVAGGAVPLGAALAWSLIAGAFGSVLAVALGPSTAPAPGRAPAGEKSVRGPSGYAGPGSLGGTESALRR